MYNSLKLLTVILVTLNWSASAQSTLTFGYTGAVQTYTVPICVTQLTVSVKGAEGGINSDEGGHLDSPGHGGCVTATLAVTPGQVLNIFVGGRGNIGTTSGAGAAGGYNGGASGANNIGTLGTVYGGGSGGGASDIRTGGIATSNRIIVGAGGGGAGLYCGLNKEYGGDGGGLTGITGGALCAPLTSTGGGGGTPSGGGLGGTCTAACTGVPGAAGTVFAGGAAGGCCSGGAGSAGGGGGGGYYGGGGGQFTGGGGGSNYADVTVASSVTHTSGCNTGNGVVLITPVCATPAITGTTTVCLGFNSTLVNGCAGGTWNSSNTAIATVDASGFVTSVSAGTTTISYTAGPCVVTSVFTVNPLPKIINGNPAVCVGLTDTLSDTTTGGTWSSGSTAVATVGVASGVVYGVTAGTTIITYKLGTGCINTTVITVNPLPVAIAGTFNVCEGLTTTLSDGTGSGTWSSSDGAIASIDASGMVTGVVAGSVTITYVVTATGCLTTQAFTVNPLPGAIGGTPVVCEGSTTALSNTGGGTWASSNSSIATIGSSGTVSGVAGGTVTITYTLPTGCIITESLLVNPLPAVITGSTVVCQGLSVTLSDASAPVGAWSSSNTTVASVDVSSGVVTGLLAGTAIISYSLPTGCLRTTSVLVNPLPAAITGGGALLCQGLTITVNDGTSGGTWTSSNTSIATVGTSGVVGGVAGGITGIDTITYTITATGCLMTTTVLVNPLSPITGVPNVCVGLTTTLTDTTIGGFWISGNTSVATVDAGGIVTGVAFGTSTITYLLPTGCEAYMTVTVNALTGITGTLTACVGLCTSLSDVTPGGVWTSGATSVATAGTSGTVCGVAAGTAIISYTLGTGCQAFATVTINPLPSAISGAGSVCQGQSTTLTDPDGTSTWSSSDGAVAGVGPGTGVVTGGLVGTATITFMLPTGCITTTSMLVNPLAPISGPASVCQGSCTNFTDAVSSGTWVSSNVAVATVDATGMVCGVTGGTAVITYTTPAGCVATKNIIVNSLPAAIGGILEVCVSQNTPLTDASTPGTWSSSTTSVATVVTGTGNVWGVSSGTTIITYTLGTGCYITASVVVDPLSPISGPSTLCQGATVTFTDAAPGGTWISSASGIASVNSSSGDVTGISNGTATITYSIAATGCEAYKTVTVYPVPVTPTGPASICVGTTGVFTSGSGGTWTSSATGIATINSSTGTAGGVSAGTATITYTFTSTGCYNTTTVTIFNLAPITGTMHICPGFCTTLSDAASGGTWSSSTTSVATVGTGGVVCGGTSGTTIITYMLPSGCMDTALFTVSPVPAAITGLATVCAGSNITWTDLTAGGTWTSSDITVATVTAGPSTTTTVHGVAAGTSTITFTVTATGCYSTRVVTVNPVPSPIVGPFSACQGLTTTISDGTTGGTWSSSTTTVATVILGPATTTTVTAVAGGTTTITYTISATGCYATAVFTVFPTPAITGVTTICQGLTTTLTETIAGGTWVSSNTTVATVITATPTTSTVTGVTSGTSVITYTFPSGCITTTTVTVNPTPTPITGPTTVCQSGTLTLTDTDPGGPGTWSSSATGIATVVPGPATTTTVTGVAGGTTTITFTLPTGCLTTYTVTINPITPITGSASLCMGTTNTLTNATAGGAWTSSNIGVATVTTGSSTTTVTPVTVGTSVITYMMASGCYATLVVTVNPLPGTISGPTSVCVGSNITLTDGGFGTWTSTPVTIATVGLGTGTAGGVSAGSATITYTLGTGCYTVTTVTVLNTPAAITGVVNICIGATSTLSDITGPAGTWSSSNTGIATVNAGPALSTTLYGVTAGNTTITYMLPDGCYTTRLATINTLPTGISGPTSVCVGATITLTDPTTGPPAGSWTSSTTTVATVLLGPSTSTTVGGVSSGTSTITYSLVTGCNATYVVTVLPLPIATITAAGPTTFCAGSFVVLNANTGPSLSYQWFALSTGAIPGATGSSYIATTGDTYTVKVSSASTSCSRTSAATVVTVSSVTADISIPGGSDSACASPGVTLFATPAGMTYQWELGGVAIAGAVFSTYTASITGTYTLLVTNAVGCTATHDTDVHIITSPGTAVALSGPTAFCAGDTVRMTGVAGTGYTYQWYNLAGPIAGATHMYYTASLANTYWVVVTNSTGCSTPSVQNIVSNTAAPGATITAAGITTFCAGGNVLLSGPSLPPPPAGTLYQWYANGIAIAGATTINYTASTTANYTLKVTNPVSGCSGLSTPVSVAAVTTPVIAPITATQFCWGGSSTLSVVIVGGAGPVSYQWYLSAAIIPGATNRTYTATVPGIYSCIVNVPGSCTITSANASVTENPLPNPLVTYDGSIYFHTQPYYVTYQWYKNNVAILGANSNTTRSTSNGNYKVAVTDTNGCQSFSDIYVLTGWSGLINEGINPATQNEAIRIYPNPAQHTVHIEANGTVRAVISSIDGKSMIDKANAKDIDISALADGIYIISLYSETGQMVKTDKLIKAAN